jgi:hypothetical protein
MTGDVISGLLLPGERIIWSGQPGGGLVLTSRDAFLIPFSLLWCGFAIFWTITATRGGAPAFFYLWGVMFVCLGLYFVAGRYVVDAWMRRGIRYALTDRRILIRRPGAFGRFTAIGLNQLPEATLSERGDGRGTIRFGAATPVWGSRGMSAWTPAFDPTPQFIAIENCRHVFDLIQQSSYQSA